MGDTFHVETKDGKLKWEGIKACCKYAAKNKLIDKYGTIKGITTRA